MKTLLPILAENGVPKFLLAAACCLVVNLPAAPQAADTVPSPYGKVIVTDGGCGGFEAWPDVKRLDNGELLVAFYAGSAHGSPPTDKRPNSGKMALVRSKDNGVTWGPVETIVDTRDDDHDGSLQQLRDGTLICNYFIDIYYRMVDGKEVRGHWWKIATRCVRSKDRGKTWSKPIEIEGPWSYVSATSDSVLQRDDGVLLMPVYGWEHTGPWRSGVLFSRDQGQTWGDFVLIEEDTRRGGTCEPALVKLPGGRILCMTRNKMAQSVSSDGGRTWSKPQTIPFFGDAPGLLYTSKGLLLCAMRHKGTSVIVSPDEGKTWRGAYRIDTVRGAYPSMCELADGTVFCVYYEEGPGSNIRAVRFRPRADGIDFVPPAEWK